MSCHNIGRALNSVQETILELYDAGKLEKEITRELLDACNNAIWFCDGNPDEASETLDKTHCGHCLKRTDQTEPLYCIWDTRLGWKPIDEYRDKHMVVGFSMCDDCFSKMLTDLGLSEEEIQKEKQRAKCN